MKNKFILLVTCMLLMVSGLVKADWIASNTTVRPGTPTACNGIEVEGSFSWFTVTPYANDLHVATMKLLLPNVVNAAMGTPSLIDQATSLPVPGVTFTLNSAPSGSSWEANFGPATVIQPFTVLIFTVTDLGVADTNLSGLLVSNTIDFLSSPPGETTGNNGSSINFGISPNPTGLAQVTGNDSLMQGDGTTVDYYDTTCRLITTVNDTTGGNVLGNTVSMVNVDATASFHNGQPYVRRWYQIIPGTNGPAEVTLYVNQSDFDDYNAVVVAPYDSLPTSGSNSDPRIGNIHVTKNDDGGLGVNPVVLVPSSVNWNSAEGYWEITVQTPSFSQFRIHSANPMNTPLGVEYKTFRVTKQETSDLVEWTTISEGNNSHFNVQRSADGNSFETLGRVDSRATNTPQELDYSFVDERPMLGHNYYRLEQVDQNGNKRYSKTIDIIWGANGTTASIYPNPATKLLNIDLSTDKVSQTEVKLLDMSGRVVKSVMAKTVKGLNHITIELEEVASGVYGVQIFEDNELTHVGKVRKN